MTTRFVSAAETMGRVLGLPGYAFAVIDHPVSSATDQELADRAKGGRTTPPTCSMPPCR